MKLFVQSQLFVADSCVRNSPLFRIHKNQLQTNMNHLLGNERLEYLRPDVLAADSLDEQLPVGYIVVRSSRAEYHSVRREHVAER